MEVRATALLGGRDRVADVPEAVGDDSLNRAAHLARQEELQGAQPGDGSVADVVITRAAVDDSEAIARLVSDQGCGIRPTCCFSRRTAHARCAVSR